MIFLVVKRNATQRNPTQRNATQRNATQALTDFSLYKKFLTKASLLTKFFRE